ncbi:C-GCAxxG-C-C family protein [Calderihabitans maritimus]|uniref:C_GCAxxG_C_C family protein n=1 Tax=Calderihabitans maritimus TaxID=1246530 RepID=A0A1Z5HUW9_9FIRM|nr:C-GCAxxG-C-C family protein [Calderihabitans maritimus]GAW93312.1 C_GCAxxG_C_C family protein [Calderihabitans maritimus]
MSETLIMEARNKAGNYFREGYNCAESIFLTFRELLMPELDANLVKLASGLGGGLGHAGCSCGALTGSVVVLGLLRGRTSTDMAGRDAIYELSREFHDRFKENFGKTCCRVLNPYEYDTKEHLRHCLKITGNTSKLLMAFLLEKQIVSTENHLS